MPTFMGAYRYAANYKLVPVVGRRFTVPKVVGWVPTLTIWGASALGAVLFFADSIPLYRQVLVKLPIIGSHYDDTVAPEDTPF